MLTSALLDSHDPGRILALVQAIGETLAEVGGQVPSGTVYAAVMAAGYSLGEYDAAVALMVRAGGIERTGDLLWWRLR